MDELDGLIDPSTYKFSGERLNTTIMKWQIIRGMAWERNASECGWVVEVIQLEAETKCFVFRIQTV